jgi:hypothetical protein
LLVAAVERGDVVWYGGTGWDLLQPVPTLRNRGPESGLKSGGMPSGFALDGNAEVAPPVQVGFRGRLTGVGKTGHDSQEHARSLRSTSGR